MPQNRKDAGSSPAGSHSPRTDPTGGAPSPEGLSPPAPRRRRRRRRLIIGGLATLVLLICVALGPTLLSTEAGTGFLVGLVNERICGRLSLDHLSLSWTGPLQLRGVRLLDPGGREVIRVDEIRATAGLWRAATGWQEFGGLLLENPHVLVHAAADGRITLADALAPRQPSQPDESAGPLPALRGRVTVRSGAVRVVREQGGSYQIGEIGGEVDLQTLNDLAGKVVMGLPGGGRLSCELKAADLFAHGSFNASDANGLAVLRAEPSIDVAPLASLIDPESTLTGSGMMTLTARAEKGVMQLELAADLIDLQASQASTRPADPVRATVKANAHWADSRLTARLDLSGSAGQAEANLSYRHAPDAVAPSAELVMASILAGDSLAWPDFSLDAKAAVDVGALGRSFPALLRIRQDRQLAGGRLDLARLSLKGGTQPSAAVAATLHEVTALAGANSIRLKPVDVEGDAILEPGRGLNVRQLTVKSVFGQVVAGGTPSEFQAELKASLAALQRELGQVFDFGDTRLAGELDSRLKLSQAQTDRMEVEFQAGLAELHYARGNRQMEVAKASVGHHGSMALGDRRPTRYVARTITLNLDEKVLANATGEYDLSENRLSAAMELTKGDLGVIGAWASGLGVSGLTGYSGDLQGQTRVEYAEAGGSLSLDGQLAGKGLKHGDAPLVEGDPRLEWSGLRIGLADQGLRLEKADLDSTPAKLTARDLRWDAGTGVEGSISASADVAGCLGVAARIAGWERTPAISGRLQWDTTASRNNAVAVMTGRAQVQRLAFGSAAPPNRTEQAELGYEMHIDVGQSRLKVSRLSLDARPLSLQASGEVRDLSSACVLSLSGQYRTSWPELTELLRGLNPSLEATFALTGLSQSPFQLTGAARDPSARPSFRGLQGGLNIAWDTADVFGVKAGNAVLSPQLRNGQVTLPLVAVPALQGRVNLAGMVDFQPIDATVRIPGRLALLENLALTREIGDLLLSRINPVFAQVSSLHGRVNLELRDLVLPLGESLKQAGQGGGRLDLHDIRLGPGSLMAQLVSLSGLAVAAEYPVEIGAVDVVLRDGRLYYDDFRLVFPGQFDLVFRGSVGLDETLDLVVSIPIRPQLLTRLKVAGPVNEYARLLAGSRVELPLVGTREKPSLDFSRVDTQKLLKGVLEKAGGQPAQDLLRLLPGVSKRK